MGKIYQMAKNGGKMSHTDAHKNSNNSFPRPSQIGISKFKFLE
jgi:hypothetical protein